MSNNFDSVRAVLSNLRSIRNFAKTVTYESLFDSVEKLNAVLKEKEHEFNEQQNLIKEKQAKIDQVKHFIEEIGLDFEDLLNPNIKIERPKKDKVKAEAKYKLPSGETWTGRGRMPNAFKEILENGEDIENFVINKEVKEDI